MCISIAHMRHIKPARQNCYKSYIIQFGRNAEDRYTKSVCAVRKQNTIGNTGTHK